MATSRKSQGIVIAIKGDKPGSGLTGVSRGSRRNTVSNAFPFAGHPPTLSLGTPISSLTGPLLTSAARSNEGFLPPVDRLLPFPAPPEIILALASLGTETCHWLQVLAREFAESLKSLPTRVPVR